LTCQLRSVRRTLHHDFFYTATQHGGFTVERG
jgi:hypothetical protein